MPEKFSEVILILVGSTLIILILISLIIATLFINQKRKFRHRQELLNLKNEYEQEVLLTQLETQKQTLVSVSRELHDNIGTLVSISIVHLNSYANSSGSDKFEKLGEVKNLLNEALDTLRDISRSIYPDHIYQKGLELSIRKELERLRRTNLFTIAYAHHGTEFFIEPGKQVVLFRIIQEGLNNILKHAEATQVNVHLHFSDSLFSISIRDNGKGFDSGEEKLLHTKTSGIKNMRNRAALIGADFRIVSSPGSGTTLNLTYSAGAVAVEIP